MATRLDDRNGLCIAVAFCLLLHSIEACPPLKQEDGMLQACQNTEDCCFVEPIYTKDADGFGCFHGCLKKCRSSDKENCVNPCNSLIYDVRKCLNPDPEHCDVIPDTIEVQGRWCFNGCRRVCE